MGAGPAGGATPRRGSGWVVAVVLGVLALVALVLVLGAWWVGDRVFGPSAAELDRPPSEREAVASRRSDPRPRAEAPMAGEDPLAGGGPSTVPGRPSAGTPGPSMSTPPIAGPDGFETLRCTFAGRGLLSPGLPYDVLGRSRQTMQLAPGATFSCRSSVGPSAGEVTMEATFESLGLFSGTGRGGGTITWDGGEVGGVPTPPSRTYNEIDLAYPEIVVWVTIEDGPFAGFRGKLVLADWERIDDADGRIAEIVFEPTEVVFSPA